MSRISGNGLHSVLTSLIASVSILPILLSLSLSLSLTTCILQDFLHFEGEVENLREFFDISWHGSFKETYLSQEGLYNHDRSCCFSWRFKALLVT